MSGSYKWRGQVGAKKDIVENFTKVFREKAEIFAEAVHDGKDQLAEAVHHKTSALSRPKKLIILGLIISTLGIGLYFMTRSPTQPPSRPTIAKVRHKHKKHKKAHKRSAKDRHKVRGTAKAAALQFPLRSAASTSQIEEKIPETGIQYLERIKANYRPITDPSKVTGQAAADSLMLYRVTHDRRYLSDCQKYMAVLMIYLKAEVTRNRDLRDPDQIMQLMKINRQMQIIGAGRPEWNKTLESYITLLIRR